MGFGYTAAGSDRHGSRVHVIMVHVGTTERTYFYLIHDRVVAERVKRPTGFGPWPPPSHPALLVASLEGQHPWTIEPGPLFSDERIIESIMQYVGRPLPSMSQHDIGQDVPESVLDDLTERIRAAAKGATDNYYIHSNEDGNTGDFFGRVRGTIVRDGWTVDILWQGFSTINKEPKVGADGGIVIDIQNAKGDRVLKALWIQAKAAEVLPGDPMKLPRMKKQVADMRARTKDAYAFVYTPNGIYTFGGSTLSERDEPDELIAQALRCRKGDRKARLIAQTYDREFVLNIVVSQAR